MVCCPFIRGALVRGGRSRTDPADTSRTEEVMEPDDLLCSRNARPQKDGRERPGALLARRTRTIRMCSLDGRSGTNTGAIQRERASELGKIIKNGERGPMRAVEDQSAPIPLSQTLSEKLNVPVFWHFCLNRTLLLTDRCSPLDPHRFRRSVRTQQCTSVYTSQECSYAGGPDPTDPQWPVLLGTVRLPSVAS